MDPTVINQEGEHISSTVMAFINNMNRDEVYERGQQLGFSWGAVKTHDELPSDGQLIDRGFWVEVEHPEMNQSFKYPGSAAIWSSSPWFISRRAPLIGEHNQEIYCGELGIDKRYLTVLSESGAV